MLPAGSDELRYLSACTTTTTIIRTTATTRAARSLARRQPPAHPRPCQGSAGRRCRRWATTWPRPPAPGWRKLDARQRSQAQLEWTEPPPRGLALRAARPAGPRLSRHDARAGGGRLGRAGLAAQRARHGPGARPAQDRGRAGRTHRQPKLPRPRQLRAGAIRRSRRHGGTLGMAVRGASPVAQRDGGAGPRRRRHAGVLRRQPGARAGPASACGLPPARRGGDGGLRPDPLAGGRRAQPGRASATARWAISSRDPAASWRCSVSRAYRWRASTRPSATA